jgi:NAD(P)-dependent dehydrogenase (short-subunit alcohol dehydrogenase family)
MADPARHQGTAAIVTGAGGGIGRATALRLAADGAAVVACDVDAEGVGGVVSEIRAGGGTASGLTVDVTRQSDVDAALAEAQRLGPVAILANVAGIADFFLPVGELDDDTWERIIAVNLTGTMRCTRAVVPLMEQLGRGAIVNISSVAGLGGGGGGSAYTASKHGVIGLAKSVAFLYGPNGIRCNAVCPGGVNTTIAQTSGYPKVPWAGERLGVSFARAHRLAEPEEIAGLISFLVSDEGANINGAVIASDGGWMSG